MKKQKTNRGKTILALVILLVSLSITGTVLGEQDSGEEVGITPNLTAKWWQWVFSIPSATHPLSYKEDDPTGKNYCMVGQQGDHWFLGGIFKIVDVSPDATRSQADEEAYEPVVIERECTVPLGKNILIPVINGECNTAEETALGNEVPENAFEKKSFLRDCAKTQADAIDSNTVAAYFGPVDSGDNWIQKPVQVKRVHTIIPFSVTYSPDNILASDCEDSSEDAFLCEPAPNPSLTHVDGYWTQVRPKKPGTYKLRTFCEVPDYDFALDITYTLTVVGTRDQYPPDGGERKRLTHRPV